MNKDKPDDNKKCKGNLISNSKRPRPDSLSSTGTTPSTSPKPPCCTEVSNILLSTENKLSGLDARIALIEVIHKDFQELRHSLEFSQEQIDTLTKENHFLKDSVHSLTAQLTSVVTQNKSMKESILDLQSRSMRDNLVFTGIPEQTPDDPEKSVKDFMIKQLKLPSETVQDITFHRVHRIRSQNSNNRPRPIIAKFEHYKQKELVQRQGRQLKGTNYGLNNQYPKDILERRKHLFPIRKQMMNEGKKAIITVDKLYINGQLYRDKDITPWLF
jgi:hypothetical protein